MPCTLIPCDLAVKVKVVIHDVASTAGRAGTDTAGRMLTDFIFFALLTAYAYAE